MKKFPLILNGLFLVAIIFLSCFSLEGQPAHFSWTDMVNWMVRGGHIASGTGTLPAVASEGARYTDLSNATSPIEYLSHGGVWRLLTNSSSLASVQAQVASINASITVIVATETYLQNQISSNAASIAAIISSQVQVIATETFLQNQIINDVMDLYVHKADQTDPHGATQTFSQGITLGSGSSDGSIERVATGTLRVSSYTQIPPELATPSSPGSFTIWADKNTGRLKIFDGTSWIDFGLGVSSDHSSLANLPFELSGHSGFASSASIPRNGSFTLNGLSERNYSSLDYVPTSASWSHDLLIGGTSNAAHGTSGLASQAALNEHKNTTVPIASGGTGAITPAGARTNLNVPAIRTYFAPSSVTVATGTASGTVTSLASSFDGNIFHIDETLVGLEFIASFTSVSSLSGMTWRFYYKGSSTHGIRLQLYNFTTLTWDTFDCHVGDTVLDFSFYEVRILKGNNYISSGNVGIKITHPESGQTSHFVEYDSLLIFSE